MPIWQPIDAQIDIETTGAPIIKDLPQCAGLLLLFI